MKKILLLLAFICSLQLVNGQKFLKPLDIKNLPKAEMLSVPFTPIVPNTFLFAKDYDNSIYKLPYGTAATEAYAMNPAFSTMLASEVKNEGDLTFPSGAYMKNVGNLTLTGAKVSISISHYPLSGGSATKLFDKTSVERTDIEADSIRGLTIEPFDFKNGKGIGRYQFTYTAAQDSVDQTKGDNSFVNNMYLTKNLVAKCKINPTSRALQITQYWGGGTAYREVLMPFSLKHGKGLFIDTLHTAIASNEGVADIYVEGRIYKWVDANGDSTVQNDEMITAAIGSATVPSTTTGNFVNLKIGLDNILGLTPAYQIEDDGAVYFASLMYPGGTKSLFNAYEMVPSFRMLVNVKDAAGVLEYTDYPYLSVRTQDAGTGGPDMSTASLFYVDQNADGTAQDQEIFFFPVSMALEFSGVVATKDISNNTGIEISVSPNPAKDVAKVDVKLNSATTARFELFTTSGKLIESETYNSKNTEFIKSYNVQSMSPGTYIVKVSTANGFVKKSFNVIK